MNHRMRLVPILLACLAAACAKPYAPPGGEQDRTPPRLMETVPAALAVVPQFNDAIVFTFNETLSERGVNDAVISVSPQPRGKVHVHRKGNRVEVTADGGWARNQIYRVVLQPGVSDRFNNARKEPVELVFSTGPPIQETAIAGLITDRITNRPAVDASVEAVRRGDSATYVTRVDTAGFFALRYVPAGVYDVRGFADANRNRRRDPGEGASLYQQVTLGGTDTVPAQLVLLPADTTPPELKRADMVDSLHISLTFDDYIDPQNGLTGQSLSITVPGSAQVAGTVTNVRLKNVQQRIDRATPPAVKPDTTQRAPRTRADSLRADSLRADSLRADSTTARLRARAAQAAAARNRAVQPADTMPLPDREVIVTLAAPMAPGTYRITTGGVRNVNGYTGGGAADVTVKPPPPKPAGRDTTQTPSPRSPDSTPDGRRITPLASSVKTPDVANARERTNELSARRTASALPDTPARPRIRQR